MKNNKSKENIEKLREELSKDIKKVSVLIDLMYENTEPNGSLEDLETYCISSNFLSERINDIKYRLTVENRSYSYSEVIKIREILNEFIDFINSFFGDFILEFIEIGYIDRYNYSEEVEDFIYGQMPRILKCLQQSYIYNNRILLSKVYGFVDKISLILNMKYLRELGKQSRNNKSRAKLMIG